MKRKPMLLSKLMDDSRGKGREVIGLIGTHHGTGVTHTGLMLAFYLGEELGRKTAYLECNNHKDMKLIQDAYEWSDEDSSSFSFHQITCFKEVKTDRISEIFGENYECLILDFGTDFNKFLRCNIKVVVGGRSEWDIPKLNLFAEASEAIRGSDSWLYFIPQTNEKSVIRSSKEIRRKVWAVPYIQEPTMPSHISNRFFSKMF